MSYQSFCCLPTSPLQIVIAGLWPYAEGGHSHRRIVHAADLTGREVERALLAAARDNPNITFFEHHLGVDLVIGEANGVPHCFGVDVLDQRANTMIRCIAPVTMLATGGGGQVRGFVSKLSCSVLYTHIRLCDRRVPPLSGGVKARSLILFATSIC